MAQLDKISTETLRDAALAWRRNDEAATMHRNCSGLLKWLSPEPNMSMHDRVSDLIDEIDRLRRR